MQESLEEPGSSTIDYLMKNDNFTKCVVEQIGVISPNLFQEVFNYTITFGNVLKDLTEKLWYLSGNDPSEYIGCFQMVFFRYKEYYAYATDVRKREKWRQNLITHIFSADNLDAATLDNMNKFVDSFFVTCEDFKQVIDQLDLLMPKIMLLLQTISSNLTAQTINIFSASNIPIIKVIFEMLFQRATAEGGGGGGGGSI